MIVFFAFIFSLNLTANLPSIKDNGHNVLYVNVENKIDISINNTNPEDIMVKVTSGNLYRRDDSTFVFTPPFEIEEFKIKLYYKKVLTEVKTMTVKKMPEPTLYFDAEVNGKISIANITASTALKFDYGNGIPETAKNKVFSYNVFIKPKNNHNAHSFAIRSEKLDENFVNFIKTQEEGTTLVINNVLAISPNGVHSRVNATKELILTTK
jgi:GldM C-terminal domain